MTLIKQGRDSLHNCSKAGSSTLHRKIMQSDHMILVLDSIKNYVMSCYVDQTMAYHGGLQAKTLPLSCSRSPTKPAVGLHVNVLEKKHYISCLFHNSVKIPPRLVGCDWKQQRRHCQTHNGLVEKGKMSTRSRYHHTATCFLITRQLLLVTHRSPQPAAVPNLPQSKQGRKSFGHLGTFTFRPADF